MSMDEYLTMNVRGEVFDGYIQSFSVKPFSITMFTEEQICFLSLNQRFLYFDATGSLIQKPSIINLHP